MPRPRNPIPVPRCHKGAAVVDVYDAGRRRTITLGPWGSTQAKEEFERLLSRQRSGVRADISVNEVAAKFITWALTHYRAADGGESGEIREYKLVIRHTRLLFGETLAAEFGPLKLKAVRQEMIAAGWCRGVVNQRVGRIVRIFKWAVSEELVPASVHHGLKTVAGLARGRGEAPESEPIKPVDVATVEATLPRLNRHLRAMVELQRLTGMRPGEVCRIRLAEIDRTGEVWIYRPSQHKTAHHGRGREIAIGPKAIAVIEEFIAGGFVIDPTSPLFSPRRAREERFAAMREKRKSRVQPSQRSRRRARPKLQPSQEYSPERYAKAVASAAKRAGAAHWHPNQLRHLFATEVRRSHGLEAAQVLLGHARADVTQVYAERNEKLAASVAKQVG